MTEKKNHPQWKALMEYVENTGGFLRMEVRFQDGVPVAAKEIKKEVKFGTRNNKGKKERD